MGEQPDRKSVAKERQCPDHQPQETNMDKGEFHAVELGHTKSALRNLGASGFSDEANRVIEVLIDLVEALQGMNERIIVLEKRLGDEVSGPSKDITLLASKRKETNMKWEKVNLSDVFKHAVGKTTVFDGSQLSSAIAMGVLSRDAFAGARPDPSDIDQVVAFDDGSAVAIETGYVHYSEVTGGDNWSQIWLFR